MIKTTLVIALSALSLLAYGQKKTDCDQLRKQQPHFTDYQSAKLDSLIALDINNIVSCISLDDIDIKLLLNPTVLATQIMQMTNEKKELNYGNIMDQIEDFKASEEYQKGRESFEAVMRYENKQVRKSDSLDVYSSFKKMGFSDSDLNELMLVVYVEENSHLTYKEALAVFINSKEPKPNKNTDVYGSTDLLYGHFVEIETLEQLKSIENRDKPTLLYFTGWADINGRKLEEAFFQNKEIRSLLSKFNCFIGYADDRAAISEEQKASYPDKDFKTKGQFINEIEKSLFPKGYQPIILIVDSDFKLMDSYSYNNDKQEFIEFLNRNKNVR